MGGVAAGFFGSSATIASVVTEQACHRSRILQRGPHHLGRVDDALLHEIDVVLGLGVKAESFRLVFEDLADDDRAFHARVFGDLASRGFKRLEHDIDARLNVGIVVGDLADGVLGAQQRHAPARYNAFLDRGAGRVEGVLDPILLLLDLDLGRTADANYGDASGELGEPLLQLLAIVVGGRSPRSAA